MTSTASLSKIKAILKNNLRQNTAILVITNIFAIFGTILSCYYHMDKRAVSYSHAPYDVTQDVALLLGFGMITLCGVVTMVLSIRVFKEIFNKRKSDAFYSLPFTRNEYYIANVLYGFLNIFSFYAVAVLTGALFTQTNLLFNCNSTIVDWVLFAKYMVVYMCITMAYYSFSVLATVLCGRIWQTIAISVIVPVSLRIFVLQIIININTIYGLNFKATGLTTVETLLSAINDGGYIKMSHICITELFVTAAVLLIGCTVFKRRRAETAEQTFSQRLLPSAIVMLISLSVAFSAINSIGDVVTRIIVLVIAVVIPNIIFNAIFYRRVFTRSTVISAALSCAVGILFILSITYVPYAVGYTDYVPEVDEIESAEFCECGQNHINSYWTYDFLFFDYDYDYDYYYSHTYELKSQEGLKALTDIHKKATEKKIIDKYFNKSGNFSLNQNCIYSFDIKYKLKDGKTVKRSYAIDTADFVELYATFVKTDDYIEQTFPFNIDESKVLFAQYEIHNYDAGESYNIFTGDIKKFDTTCFKTEAYDELLAALKKDIKARGIINSIMQTSESRFYITNWLGDEIDVNIYYLSSDTPPEIEEDLKTRKPSQIRYYYSNEGYSEEYKYVYCDTIVLSEKDVNTIEFLQQNIVE